MKRPRDCWSIYIISEFSWKGGLSLDDIFFAVRYRFGNQRESCDPIFPELRFECLFETLYRVHALEVVVLDRCLKKNLTPFSEIPWLRSIAKKVHSYNLIPLWGMFFLQNAAFEDLGSTLGGKSPFVPTFLSNTFCPEILSPLLVL